MNRMLPPSWITALCTLCLTLPILAQPEEKVEVRFVSFPKMPDAHPVELAIGPGKTIEVELPTNSVSDGYIVERPTHWALGKTTVNADNKPVFQQFGTAPTIAAKKQLVLVLLKGKTYEDGLELITMDGNDKGLGGGKYLLFNATKVDIAGRLGDIKFMIKPGQHNILEPKPSEEKGDRKFLHTYLYFRKDDEAKPFYSSTWRFNTSVRSLIFVYHDPNTQQLRTHSIRDYLQ